MCNTCGCNITPGNRPFVLTEKPANGTTTVTVLKNLLAKNDSQAEHNRSHFDARKVLAINLMSSPGSGKTALLEATIKRLNGSLRLAVIEGDLETENDAARIRAHGVPAYQITTGTACHLDAHLVHDALHHIDLSSIDILFIENVGNLVCPASFDLGHHLNVTLLSTTEGDDKPAKYPVMFRAADLMLITKTDLLPFLDDFSPERAEQALRNLASKAPVFNLSSRQNGDSGLGAWIDWLHEQLQAHRNKLAQQQTTRPNVQRDGQLLHADPAQVRFRPVLKAGAPA
ncbi:hydrogenase nickel incorporation protein HypB [Methylotuvimicrobium buryatense]|uniref:Hydrogenase maturation factor HypB n=1 Tax=Methylotuvimicrobium buryatense TaxID=95641 RepID=A0A4P9UMX8_METBY|nr:hydrogenase nickel incorporation protein HypB [Methylotuvimicrobium buryatense]QCW82547.1 hydrogenase accessory protein HypB [Methylotuvimicrobium buryatense]